MWCIFWILTVPPIGEQLDSDDYFKVGLHNTQSISSDLNVLQHKMNAEYVGVQGE